MAGMLKRLKKSRMLEGKSHKEKRKVFRKLLKNATNPKKIMAKKKTDRKKQLNQVSNRRQSVEKKISPNLTPLEKLMRQNQIDEREIRKLEKNLRMNKSKPTPAIFYSEGVGDIIDLCNLIMKDSSTGNPIDFLSNDYLPNETNSKKSLNSDDASSLDEQEDTDKDFYQKLRQISQDIVENSDEELEAKYYDVDDEVTSLSSKDDKSDDINSEADFSNDKIDRVDLFEKDISEFYQNIESAESNPSSTNDVMRENNIELNNKGLYGDGSLSNEENALKRLKQMEDSEERKTALTKLSRQFTSILNRVTDSNYIPCINQLEKIFESNPKNDCCSKLSEGIIDFCVQPKLTQDSILLSMTIIVQTLTYKISPELLVTLLQKLCQIFEKNFNEANGDDLKYLQNCILLFTIFYRFNLIQIVLVDDIITKLIERCLEQDVEMVLLCLRYSGLHLKKTNSTLLKKWISSLNERASENAEWLLTPRVTFMLETINNLGSSKVKKEFIHEFNNDILENFLNISKNFIKSQKNSINNDMDGINFSYSQLLDTDSSGKWWLVGSTLAFGTDVQGAQSSQKKNTNNKQHNMFDHGLIQLSKQHRMNTQIKQNIFCTLMTTKSVQDAFAKLIKFNLTGKETSDIAHVTLYCCLQEQNFNMFYPKLILEFCRHHRTLKVTSFQFALWDKIRTIGPNSTKVFLSNLNSLLVQLLVTEAITLRVLKIVTFQDVTPFQLDFFKDLFAEILQLPIGSLKSIFDIFSKSNNLCELAVGIKYFLVRHVSCASHSDGSLNSSQQKLISDKVKVSCAFIDGSDPTTHTCFFDADASQLWKISICIELLSDWLNLQLLEIDNKLTDALKFCFMLIYKIKISGY